MRAAVAQSLHVPVASVCQAQCAAMVTQTAGTAQMKRTALKPRPAPPNTAARIAKSVWCRSGSVTETRTAKMARMRRYMLKATS